MSYPSISAAVAFVASPAFAVLPAAMKADMLSFLAGAIATATAFDQRCTDQVWPAAVKG